MFRNLQNLIIKILNLLRGCLKLRILMLMLLYWVLYLKRMHLIALKRRRRSGWRAQETLLEGKLWAILIFNRLVRHLQIIWALLQLKRTHLMLADHKELRLILMDRLRGMIISINLEEEETRNKIRCKRILRIALMMEPYKITALTTPSKQTRHHYHFKISKLSKILFTLLKKAKPLSEKLLQSTLKKALVR